MASEQLLDLVARIELKPEDADVGLSGGGGLRIHALEVEPYVFLRRAEDDFELGGDASELNAITNAKRAIVAQMDQALLSFGYPATTWKISKKVDALNALGLVAPRILRRVSGSRNLLEHEYRRPTKSEVEEALDLAALFVAAIRPVFYTFCDEFSIGNHSEQIDFCTFRRELSFTMQLASAPATFRVGAYVHSEAATDGLHGTCLGETELDAKDELFPVVVRLALEADRDYRFGRTLEEFCLRVCRPTGR